MNIEIEIAGEKRVVNNVPETSWEALKPYWPSIVKAVIEVFLEGDFKPYSVRKNKKDGFCASEWYWKQSLVNPEGYPLKEAERFVKMLLKKKYFVESIKEFNESSQVDWTSKENVMQLRRFLYSNCSPLEGFLRLLKANR